MALLPPIFPQAGTIPNIIPILSVSVNGGVRIRIPIRQGEGPGDEVNLWWNGVNFAYQVLGDDYEFNPVEFLVDQRYVTIGNYEVYYTIDDFRNPTSFSEIVTLQITPGSTIPSDQLQMVVTRNASNHDLAAINVKPFNRGVVTGQPGQKIFISTTSPGLIAIGDSGRNYVEMSIGDNGQADFSVFSEEQGPFSVSAYDYFNNANNITLFTFTGPYRIGSGDIKSVNYSIGAPANNRTVNSIYLKTQAFGSGTGTPLTLVHAQITSTFARFNGTTLREMTFPLNTDNSATIDLVSPVSELTTVVLTLPQQTGTTKSIVTNFVVPSLVL
ncbi:hypothetical protein [Yersinia sp. 2466 StPb PI]|uniref:hypothetical protein n=1 Tax=Yersinia sp. 2466 StPb PI TaxID=3061648 RepID=UPI00355C6673